jgi:hypothetical protein
MRRFIVTKKQLNEYVETKKAEKVFNSINEDLQKNVTLLNENISHKKVNQSVIDNYRRKNLITPKVYEMLLKHKIIDDNYKIM